MYGDGEREGGGCKNVPIIIQMNLLMSLQMCKSMILLLTPRELADEGSIPRTRISIHLDQPTKRKDNAWKRTDHPYVFSDATSNSAESQTSVYRLRIRMSISYHHVASVVRSAESG